MRGRGRGKGTRKERARDKESEKLVGGGGLWVVYVSQKARTEGAIAFRNGIGILVGRIEEEGEEERSLIKDLKRHAEKGCLLLNCRAVTSRAPLLQLLPQGYQRTRQNGSAGGRRLDYHGWNIAGNAQARGAKNQEV